MLSKINNWLKGAGTLDFDAMPVYSLTVKVTDNGEPTQSASATITININDLVETGVLTALDGSAINLFPNPAKGQVQINVTGEAMIRVMDLSGHLVKEEVLRSNTLNIESLKTGVYMVEVSQNGQKAMKKLVIE